MEKADRTVKSIFTTRESTTNISQTSTQTPPQAMKRVKSATIDKSARPTGPIKINDSKAKKTRLMTGLIMVNPLHTKE
ncbi:hypothetical protein [Pseudomonas sp. CFBP 13719]|uniref:hypothetical protein n=1 Tax=Pseudomonas sp. CFBP 13719 TaxID=2775303 RepID=UPI0017872995|nr:hypothetical protein [Pseudomonas sp. CFBP 13719]MBD8680314.1 hypothetical protein [Pseudomonas sp. CFBP 13719]